MFKNAASVATSNVYVGASGDVDTALETVSVKGWAAKASCAASPGATGSGTVDEKVVVFVAVPALDAVEGCSGVLVPQAVMMTTEASKQ
jgi:hypothetical protein